MPEEKSLDSSGRYGRVRKSEGVLQPLLRRSQLVAARLGATPFRRRAQRPGRRSLALRRCEEPCEPGALHGILPRSGTDGKKDGRRGAVPRIHMGHLIWGGGKDSRRPFQVKVLKEIHRFRRASSTLTFPAKFLYPPVEKTSSGLS